VRVKAEQLRGYSVIPEQVQPKIPPQGCADVRVEAEREVVLAELLRGCPLGAGLKNISDF
jgi:hypothetical protein